MLIFCGAPGHVPVVLSMPSTRTFMGILSLRIQEMGIRNYFQNFCDRFLWHLRPSKSQHDSEKFCFPWLGCRDRKWSVSSHGRYWLCNWVIGCGIDGCCHCKFLFFSLWWLLCSFIQFSCGLRKT